MRWWQRRGLRFKMTMGISLTLVLILGSVFYIAFQYIQMQLWQREVQAAREINALVPVYLENAMLANHWDQVQEMLMKLGQSEAIQIDDIAIYSTQSKLVSFASGFTGGRTIRRSSMEVDVKNPACAACHRSPGAERPGTMTVSLEGQEVIRSSLPLYNQPDCQTCHGTEKKILGVTLVDFRMDRYRQTSTMIILRFAVGGILAVVLVVLALYLLMHRMTLSPLEELLGVMGAVARGQVNRQVQVRSGDEVGRLALAFNSMTEQLRGFIGNLEQRVAERTAELAQRGEELEKLNVEMRATAQKAEQRATQLAASAQVARAASQVRDLDQLLPQVTQLISRMFGYYHVGIFIVDELGRFAVLRAANSEGGRHMLARNHKLAVGTQGIVGYVTGTGQPRVALDIGSDAVHFDNPDLPQTRSEMALPLHVGDQVFGALDVQSTQEAAFTEEDLAVLSMLADQLAIAIENARLFEQTRSALQEAEEAQRRYIREQWAQLAPLVQVSSHEYHALGVPPVGDAPLPEIEQALLKGEIVTAAATTLATGAPAPYAEAMAIPIKLAEETLGVIDLQVTDDARGWTEDDMALATAVADQVALALENARLFDQTQRRAQRERLISEIASKMRVAPDVEGILRTTVQEIRRALGVSHGVIRLRTQELVPASRKEAGTR